jgi:hypothetical protein
LNGTGGPIVFIRTDGERWIFSRMVCDKGVPIVQHSGELKLDISQSNIDDSTVRHIFDWLRYAITIGQDSTPRASLPQID